MRSTLLVALTLAVTGCHVHDDTLLRAPDRATFADADDALRYEALLVAVGGSLEYAEEARIAADVDSQVLGDGSPCPKREEVLEGDILRVRYGTGEACTTDDGVLYAGTIEADASAAVFDDFLVDDGATHMVLDGSWSRSDDADGAYAVTAHLRTEVAGSVWQVHGTWEYRDQGDHFRVTCGDGLQGAVSALGGFDVRCELRDFGAPASEGWVEITAEDTMRVDTRPDTMGCYAVTIDRVVQPALCPPGSPGDVARTLAAARPLGQ